MVPLQASSDQLYELDINVYNIKNSIFSKVTPTFLHKEKISELSEVNIMKNDNIFHIIDQIRAHVVNQALPSVHGGSLEITLTVPLKCTRIKPNLS